MKGESAVRIYAGDGTRAGRKVGFYVKLDEADMKPKGVVIPKKYGLATYAHHWRKLWTIDRRGPLYEFILHQMPGEYEELDAPKPPPAPKIPAYNEASIARTCAEADRLYAEYGLPYRAQGLAEFLDGKTGSKLTRATIFSEHDGEDVEGCGHNLAIALATNCYEVMSARQKENVLTGEDKDKLDAGVEALRGFLYEHTGAFDNDPLAREEAAARLDQERARPSPPARLTNEQFEAQVYKIITEKTGINYQEAYKLCITKKSQEKIHELILSFADQNSPDKAADRVIDSYSNFIKRHVQSLTALYEGRDDGYEHITLSPESAEYRRQVMEQVAKYQPNELWNKLPQRIKNHFYVDVERYWRDNDTLQMAVWRIVSGLHGFIVNEIVFENTGFNHRMFFTESERAQFDKIICDDYLKKVPPSITAGKVIERFKGHVLAHFMSLTGIAPGIVVL